jgi:hypothetical protein
MTDGVSVQELKPMVVFYCGKCSATVWSSELPITWTTSTVRAETHYANLDCKLGGR